MNTLPTAQASRRALLFGIAAVGAVASPAVASAMLEGPTAPAIAAVPPPAVATPSPDTALLQLFDEYMTHVTEYQRAYGLYKRGRAKQQAKYPMPDVPSAFSREMSSSDCQISREMGTRTSGAVRN